MTEISTLAALGLKALEYAAAVNARKAADARLRQAYEDFKEDGGHHAYFERNSPTWHRMIEATEEEYAAVRRLKDVERGKKISLLSCAAKAQADIKAAASTQDILTRLSRPQFGGTVAGANVVSITTAVDRQKGNP